MAKVIADRQSRSTLLLSISHELRIGILACIGELKFCIVRLYETSRRDEKVRDPRRDAETFWAETETRPETHKSETKTRPRRWAFCLRRDVSTSRDSLETETSRPRPHPWRRMTPSDSAEGREQWRELTAVSMAESSWMMKTWLDLVCIVYDRFLTITACTSHTTMTAQCTKDLDRPLLHCAFLQSRFQICPPVRGDFYLGTEAIIISDVLLTPTMSQLLTHCCVNYSINNTPLVLQLTQNLEHFA